MLDGSNLSQETLTLAAKSPDERRLWLQFLRQVLYRDAGGGKMHYDCSSSACLLYFLSCRNVFLCHKTLNMDG